MVQDGTIDDFAADYNFRTGSNVFSSPVDYKEINQKEMYISFSFIPSSFYTLYRKKCILVYYSFRLVSNVFFSAKIKKYQLKFRDVEFK